jgi:2-keto-4-pentenoate hydratase
MIGKLFPQAAIYEAEDIQSAIHIAPCIEVQLALIDVILGDEDSIA